MFYHVEMKRISWINLRIEAESPAEAEKLAWEEIDTDGSYASADADWFCNGVYKEEK